jgi:hypothetical protein
MLNMFPLLIDSSAFSLHPSQERSPAVWRTRECLHFGTTLFLDKSAYDSF